MISKHASRLFKVAGLATSAILIASSPVAEARFAAGPQSSIEAQAGCYEVTFEFTETFLRKPGHVTRSAHYRESGLEWIELAESRPGRVELQHVLLTPNGALKHWRQVWEKDPKHVWQFRGDGVWRREGAPLAGPNEEIWVQRVYQVDDGPRYECASSWVFTSDDPYWECRSWSPLPRREFSQRSDYNVLDRRNRHHVFSWGWRHEQDNLKLKVTGDAADTIAEEKGYNTYLRVPSERCDSARAWWADRESVWNDIQSVWNELYVGRVREIRLHSDINGRPLWNVISEIAERAARQGSGYDRDILKAETRAAIESYRN